MATFPDSWAACHAAPWLWPHRAGPGNDGLTQAEAALTWPTQHPIHLLAQGTLGADVSTAAADEDKYVCKNLQECLPPKLSL